MEIVFVWINNFRNLKDAGFNLGSEYYYDLHVDYDKRECKLTRTQNENYIPDFFKPFLNITAIVGENASGKSSFIEAIRQIMNKQRDYHIEYFILYNKDGRTYYDYYMGSEESEVDVLDELFPTLNHIRDIEYKITISGFDADLLDNNNLLKQSMQKINSLFKEPNAPESKKTISNKITSTIFFSQIIDPSINFYSDSSFDIDISSSWLAYDDIRIGLDMETHYNPFAFHRFEETYRQIQFCLEQKFNKLTQIINLPTKVDFSSNFKVNYLPNNDHHNTNYRLRGFDKKILDIILKKRKKEVEDKRQINFNYFLEDIIRCIYHNFEKSNRHLDTNFNIEISVNDIEYLEPYDAICSFLLNQDLFDGKAAVDFIDEIKTSIYGSDEVAENSDGASWSAEISNNTLTLIDKYELFIDSLSQFSSYSDPDGLLYFDWRNMSTGEKAYLNLFSRFYHAKKLIKEKLEKPTFRAHENILPETFYILIDEGEIGFHLQWQKEYIQKLHSVLPEILSFDEQDVKLQLIFTTHSPISLSDMPNDRVIYLKDGKVQSGKKKTFGANIAELFADSFFFENGLIGDFAKDRIDKTIDWLRNKDNNTSAEYHKKVIAYIDEPIIQHKLAEMYSDKMKDTFDRDIERTRIQKLKEDFKLKYGEDA